MCPELDFFFSIPIIKMTISIDQVFDAYFDCRKHKRNSVNQLRFEADLESNLLALHRDLVGGTYKIGRSVAFVITHPKIREVWAANFRDRIVHHIIYNAISPYFYRRFIRESYACIPGRGIHDGMRRVSGFARSITQNWSHPAYVLKLDVANFFNGIDIETLSFIFERYPMDDYIRMLLMQTLHHDPRGDTVWRSTKKLFDLVPDHKSYRLAPHGKGLPIGNLTSQFFANIYMNELDQYVKHVLKVKYYGRYVDDMILMHHDPHFLRQCEGKINCFLQTRLGLSLHPNKSILNRADKGIDFVGFMIKPGRTYLRKTSLVRCKQKIKSWKKQGRLSNKASMDHLCTSVNSYLGMLRQVNGYNARQNICQNFDDLFVHANEEYTKIKHVL
jgi:RNA-directed DNA polymerase